MKNTALSSLVVLALLELPRSAHSFTAATTRPQPPSPLAGGPVVRRSSRTRLRGLKIPDFLARNRSPEPEMTELALEATTAADTTSAEVIEAGGGGEEPTETQTLLQKVKQAGTAGGECFSPVFRWMNRFCFFRTLDAQNIYSFPRLARLCVLGIFVFAIAEIIIKKSRLVRSVGIGLLGRVHPGVRAGIPGGRGALAGLLEQGGSREGGRRGIRVRQLREACGTPPYRPGAQHDTLDRRECRSEIHEEKGGVAVKSVRWGGGGSGAIRVTGTMLPLEWQSGEREREREREREMEGILKRKD